MTTVTSDVLVLFVVLSAFEYVDAIPNKRRIIDCKSTCFDGMAKLKRLNNNCGYCNGTEYFEYDDCTCILLVDEYPEKQYCPPLSKHTFNPVVDKDKASLCTKEKCSQNKENSQMWTCCDNPDDDDPACQVRDITSNPTTQPQVSTQRVKVELSASTQTTENDVMPTSLPFDTTGLSITTDNEGRIAVPFIPAAVIAAVAFIVIVAVVSSCCYYRRHNEHHCDHSDDIQLDPENEPLRQIGVANNHSNGLPKDANGVNSFISSNGVDTADNISSGSTTDQHHSSSEEDHDHLSSSSATRDKFSANDNDSLSSSQGGPATSGYSDSNL